MEIPRIKQDNNTKQEIIQILGGDWPLSAKQIHHRLSKHKEISYQAAFKALQELILDKVIDKENRGYKLSHQWIKDLSKFSLDLDLRYNDHSLGKPKVEISVAYTTEKNAFIAGREVANKALSQITTFKDKIKLALLFVSINYEESFSSLLEGLKNVIGEVPIAGISTFGEIFDTRINGSISLMLFAGGDDDFNAKVWEISTNPTKNELSLINFKDRNLALLFAPGPSRYNALGNPASEILTKIKSVAPKNLPIIGGVAADEGRLVKTYLFSNKGATADKAMIVGIKTTVEFSICAKHGYGRFNPSKEYYFALSNHMIDKISVFKQGKKSKFAPAVETYASEIGLTKADLIKTMPFFTGPKGNFKEWIKLTAFARKSSSHTLSYPFDICNDKMIFTGKCTEDEPFIMMDTNSNKLHQSANLTLKEALTSLKSKPQCILILPCAIFNVIIANYDNEIKALKQVPEAADVPIVGAYVNGEIGPYESNADLCNGSVTCIVFGK